MSERSKPIPKEQLDAAVRRLSRQIGAEIVRCMAETDTSVEQIAVTLGIPAKKVWKRIHRFIEGSGDDLKCMAEIAFAMGCRWNVSFDPIEAAEADTAEQS